MVIYDLESSGISLPRLCRPIASAPSPGTTDSAAPRGCVSALEWYACDTGMFMSAHMDGVLRFWDTNTMQIIQKFDFRENPEAICCASLTPTGRYSLAALGRSGETQIRLVDYRTRATTQTLARGGHTQGVRVVRWHPTDDNILASGGSDGRCFAWDIRSPNGPLTCFETQEDKGRKGRSHASRHAHSGAVCGAEFAAGGQYLVTVGSGAGASLWSTQTGQNLAFYQVYHVVRSGTLRFATFDIRKSVRTCTQGRMTRQRAQFRVQADFEPRRRNVKVESDDHDPKSLVCRAVVALPERSRISLFDLHSGVELASLRGHLGELRAIAARSQFQEVYTSADDHQLTCWSPKMDSDVIRLLQADEEDKREESGVKRRRVVHSVTQSVYADNWSDSD